VNAPTLAPLGATSDSEGRPVTGLSAVKVAMNVEPTRPRLGATVAVKLRCDERHRSWVGSQV
jgi:hypothetical protein